MKSFLKRSGRLKIFLVICSILLGSDARADEIFLKNGDRITGRVIGRDGTAISLLTESMGAVEINMEQVERVVLSDAREEEASSVTVPGKAPVKIEWKKELSIGVDAARGNTHTTGVAGDFLVNRNHVHVNEITLKGNMFYAEEDKKTDSQKWYTLARYAFSFSPSRKWYNFYRVETDHNKFSDIYYRVVPASGIGYWFSDRDDFKFLAEAALGWEHTAYISDNKDEDEIVLVPRVSLEKKVLDNTSIAGDVYFYPSIRDFSDYRLRAEASVTSGLTDNISIRASVINEYVSSPVDEDIKNNDIRLLTSLVFSM